MTDAWLAEIQARFDRAAHSAGIGRVVARLDLEAHAETDLELLLAEVERLREETVELDTAVWSLQRHINRATDDSYGEAIQLLRAETEVAACKAERARYGDAVTSRIGELEAEVERLRRVGALVAASAMSVHPTARAAADTLSEVERLRRAVAAVAMSVHPTTRAAADTLSEVERLRAANDRAAFEVEALREERAALQARVSALKRQCRGAVAGCRRVMTQLRAVRRSRR